MDAERTKTQMIQDKSELCDEKHLSDMKRLICLNPVELAGVTERINRLVAEKMCSKIAKIFPMHPRAVASCEMSRVVRQAQTYYFLHVYKELQLAMLAEQQVQVLALKQKLQQPPPLATADAGVQLADNPFFAELTMPLRSMWASPRGPCAKRLPDETMAFRAYAMGQEYAALDAAATTHDTRMASRCQYGQPALRLCESQLPAEHVLYTIT